MLYSSLNLIEIWTIFINQSAESLLNRSKIRGEYIRSVDNLPINRHLVFYRREMLNVKEKMDNQGLFPEQQNKFLSCLIRLYSKSCSIIWQMHYSEKWENCKNKVRRVHLWERSSFRIVASVSACKIMRRQQEQNAKDSERADKKIAHIVKNSFTKVKHIWASEFHTKESKRWEYQHLPEFSFQ